MNDLILVCETCCCPVVGDTGSLYVRFAEVTAAQRAQAEWETLHPGDTAIDIAELAGLPDDVLWHAAHYGCRTDRGTGCYEIDASRIAAWPHVARWTAHLMEKNWLGLTDWDVLLRELSGESPARRIRVAAREAA